MPGFASTDMKILKRSFAGYQHQYLYVYSGLLLVIFCSIVNALSPLPCAASQEDCSSCQTLGDLRLVGGENFTQGRLEFCYNNTWGTVCDNGFGIEDATVACRQLGFSDEGALNVPFATFGEGTGPIVLDFVNCVGNEARLTDCGHNGLGQHSCSHVEDVGVKCMIQSIGSISVTTPIQSITPTQVAMATSMTASSVRPSMSQVVTLGLSLLGSTNSASLTSGITQTAIAPSLVLATSGALLPLPSQATQLLESVTPTSPDAGRSQDKEGSLSTGLIVGLAFLFLPLITFVSIVISLVAIIFLRKRKEKKIKKNTRQWYVQEKPLAQSASFERGSIFNQPEETNQSLGPSGERDSAPDITAHAVPHKLPLFTVPSAYNITPGLETKTVPGKKIEHDQWSDRVHDGYSLTESSPSNVPSITDINANDRVTYIDLAFKSPGTRKDLHNVQEKGESDVGSDWSQQLSFDADQNDKETEEGDSKPDILQ